MPKGAERATRLLAFGYKKLCNVLDNEEVLMKVSDLSTERQAHLKEMRAIDKDSEGNEVFVGLTVEETSFYLNYVQQRLAGDDDPTDGERYLKLHDKHEKARFSVLGAEHTLRTEKPSIH